MKGKRWWGPAAVILVFFVGFISGDLVADRRTAQANVVYEKLKIFGDVLSAVQTSYVEEPNMDQIVEGAIKGMLQTLDPHSSYLTPEMLKQVEVETKGVFGGLGIEIGIKDGTLTVIAPIEDTPAFRAGLKAGDKIVKIENESTKDMNVMDAVKRLRGEPGTKVTIRIMREGFTESRPFTITRDIIKIKSVKAKDLGEGIGYIKLLQFQQDSDNELEKAIQQQKKGKGGLRGLVLDLRNNPGGLLDQAVKVADKFIESGLIVYTDGRIEAQKFKYSAHQDGTHGGFPIVVLVNAGSASASEIVAGALQDHGRAVVLGTQTFGKGSVQTILPLEDGSALRLTTARYFTPNGRSIQAKGIEPDIAVRDGREPLAGRHPGPIREKDIQRHLRGEGEEEAEESPEEPLSPTEIKLRKEEPGGAKDGKDPSSQVSEARKGEEKDIQLERAVELLKGWEIFKTRFLDKAKAS
ncbi:MAG TPA: S41 family peptidase [Candidatus Deferrimicrobiaceae bacterium]|nr:S41 family peptidase [Candidatus Deferrimicrobiaceae bacterium]